MAGDSGGIRIIGLPRGSTVMIDEKPVSEPLTRLLPGPHALGVSAPRYNFYSDTVVVKPGELLEITPQLSAIGSPELPRRKEPVVQRPVSRCEPGAGYTGAPVEAWTQMLFPPAPR